MKKTNWNKVQKLFSEALELKKEDRDSYLKEKCLGDKELYNEILSLLNEDDKIHPVFLTKKSVS